ncbi:hypothetical protein N7490_010423 [Penicillium lividum]|nr:hypothetical protein N7490_010423 [Penicillium lividum]
MMGYKARKFDKTFLPRPPLEALQPEKGVPKPDIFEEVQLGPYVSKTDAKIAYQVWSLPDQALGKAWRQHKDRPYPQRTGDLEVHILVHNVYEHLMSEPLLPISRQDAKIKFEADGLENDWETAGIIEEFRDDIIKESKLSSLQSWSSSAIRELLAERCESTAGDRNALMDRTERTELARHCGIMPRSNLPQWGTKTETMSDGNIETMKETSGKYVLQPFENDWMTTLDMYTFAVHLSPYNPAYWTSRAYCHKQLAYFDLALGDAYRAKTLCDVLTNGDERSRRPGLYPRIWHAIEQHLLAQPRTDGTLKPEIQRLRERGPTYFVSSLVKALDHIITLSLMALNCWHDLDGRYNSFRSNMIMVQDRDSQVPQFFKDIVTPLGNSRQAKRKADKSLFWHERFQGCVSARSYPYKYAPVDRSTEKFCETVNSNIFHGGSMAQACRILRKDVDFGVFATRDIKKGEMIHHEEPTIRSHLRPRRMIRDESAVLEETRCENCKRKIKIAPTRLSLFAGTNFDRCPCLPLGKSAPGPDDRLFCRSNTNGKFFGKTEGKSCRQIACQLHHFSSCGKDWSWLHDAMRPVIRKWQNREYIIQSNDVYGTMHSLLLRSIFEITLHRRKDDPRLSPLEIDELLVPNADYTEADLIPFSYVGNITVPFDILTCLGVDIFRDLSFDTWVIQTIMRKLLNHAIPWDEDRRGDGPELLPGDSHKHPEHPDRQDTKVKEKKSFKEHDPSFKNLYLFPGLSLFKRDVSANANWGYDHKVPNRVIVWAVDDIKKGEEIAIRDPFCYYPNKPIVDRTFKSSQGSKGLADVSKDKKTETKTGEKRKTTTEVSKEDNHMSKKIKVEHKTDTKVDAAVTEPKEKFKRKREYAEVDDIRVSIYRELEEANPPQGKKRREAKSHHEFKFQADKRHENWYKELEKIGKMPNETEKDKEKRIDKLKEKRLVNYRREQRKTIDEKDKWAGRLRRKRDAAFE